MSRLLVLASLIAIAFSQPLPAQGGASSSTTQEVANLSRTYLAWRQAVMNQNAREWERLTAAHRRMEVRNRLVSEKRPFPAAVFDLPAPPPKLEGLRAIHFSKKGPTAKVAYFGKIDFGVGGDPTENLLVLSFVNERGGWKYDKADYVNLMALPDVRKELANNDLQYVRETPECQASGQVPRPALPVREAPYIAKVYVFCPGREVEVTVNRVSQHRFANAKEAEVVIGGARDGVNQVEYRIKKLEGGSGDEALAIRVYLMSQIDGTKPIKAFEYQIEEGGSVAPGGKGQFTVDADTAAALGSP